MACVALVCAEQLITATLVLLSLAKASISSIAFPHPSGPTKMNGSPEATQGAICASVRCTSSTITCQPATNEPTG
eukprot:4560195-Pyramimonas_sp.AAC.1